MVETLRGETAPAPRAARPARPPATEHALADARPMRIHIRGLRASAIIGIRPRERVRRQRVVLDLALDVATRAGATDRIADAVDYKRLKDAVRAHVERSRFNLLEALAESVAALALRHPNVLAIDLLVEKPGALRYADSVAVQVQRERPAPDGEA